MRGPYPRVVIAIAFAGVAACSPVATEVGLDGTLTILEPRHDFSVHRLSDDWLIVGAIKKHPPTVESADNQLHLSLASGGQPYALIKRLRARLLATPFLAWNWSLTGVVSPKHPVQITIGFADTEASGRRLSFRNIFGRKLPAFSRTLVITWGDSALRRGTLEVRRKGRDGRPAAVYVERGGRENLGRWWRAAVDLSALYAKAWPGLDMSKTRIVFAGIVMTAGARSATAKISALRLSR